MRIVPVKMPFFIQRLLKRYVWHIVTCKNEKVLYLTFDDGPTPEITLWTLNVLKRYNAKATFFCIGANIDKHPKIFTHILDQGHRIGNHTQDHIKGWKTSPHDYLKNIDIAQATIKSQVSNPESQISNLFRPPYGQISRSQGKLLIKKGYKIIMWSILSFDWEQTVSQEQCYNNVINKARNGDIIVFHDSLKASKNMQYALPKVLEYYTKLGYSFKQIPE